MGTVPEKNLQGHHFSYSWLGLARDGVPPCSPAGPCLRSVVLGRAAVVIPVSFGLSPLLCSHGFAAVTAHTALLRGCLCLCLCWTLMERCQEQQKMQQDSFPEEFPSKPGTGSMDFVGRMLLCDGSRAVGAKGAVASATTSTAGLLLTLGCTGL